MIGGFDISTSIIGYTFLDEGGAIVDIGHIDMSRIERNVWKKAEYAKEHLIELCSKHRPKHVFVEDPVSRFSEGKSSSHTIALLIRFNTLCSYFLAQTCGIESPVYLTASHARKLCGIKIQRGTKEKAKEQVFRFISKTDPFKDREWPLKRTGLLKDSCYDEVDSYVIARAGFVELNNS